jgi:UDP-N-acetylglucosamine 2-epimerase (non-hydrolysing)
MLKVMTIIGTRPELIKMSRVIAEFDLHTEHVLVHTGQNYDYELNQIFFDEMNIRKPDYFLEVAGENAAQTIGHVIISADEILRKEKPDAVLLYGDTNSCLAVISAKRLKIPVFHFEAGNRCFNQRVPEELNRKIIDHLSDINLVLSEHARRYLIAEGIAAETIIKTGSHMQEVLEYYLSDIEKTDVLKRNDLKQGEYFIVSAHREENVDSPENLSELLNTLNVLADEYNLPIIVSTHPRTQKRLNEIENIELNELIRFAKPFGFVDYIKLQLESYCVISDSGTITEEAALLNFPAITIRDEHERPEGFDAGTLIMSGLKQERVLEAIKIIKGQQKELKSNIGAVADYEAGAVSKKALRIVQSYVDYINKNVWSSP